MAPDVDDSRMNEKTGQKFLREFEEKRKAEGSGRL